MTARPLDARGDGAHRRRRDRGPHPDPVEPLALNAGSSVRHVNECLVARWGVTIEEAVRVARERVLELPLVRLDRAVIRACRDRTPCADHGGGVGVGARLDTRTDGTRRN